MTSLDWVNLCFPLLTLVSAIAIYILHRNIVKSYKAQVEELQLQLDLANGRIASLVKLMETE